MLGAEVGTQVNDLPRAQTNKHTHSAEGEPLDTLIGALVGITQTLFTAAEVFHLADDVSNHFLDATEVGLDGLQLLLGLNAGPVAGVGTDLNIKFNFTGRVGNGVCGDSRLGFFIYVRSLCLSTS